MKKLIKNQIYTLTYGKKVVRVSYDNKYKNKEINEMIYIFKSLDKFTTYTLESKRFQVYIL